MVSENGELVVRDNNDNLVQGGLIVSDVNGQSQTSVNDTDITINLGDTYNEPGISSTDALGEDVEITVSSDLNNMAIGDYTITYTATDSYGNTSVITRDILVRDSSAPTVTINGETSVVVLLFNTYIDAGATATDNSTLAGGSVPVVVTNNVNTSIPGTYSVVYTATDSSGNVGTATRTVDVQNTISPVFTPKVIIHIFLTIM